jgi:hypothetical protein
MCIPKPSRVSCLVFLISITTSYRGGSVHELRSDRTEENARRNARTCRLSLTSDSEYIALRVQPSLFLSICTPGNHSARPSFLGTLCCDPTVEKRRQPIETALFILEDPKRLAQPVEDNHQRQSRWSLTSSERTLTAKRSSLMQTSLMHM